MNFRDPLSLEESKSGCNGNLENGHLEDSVDPLDTTLTNGQSIALKKKRKSSAEKFLEDQSEYYGFQVLPSKLRSSSVESNLSNSTFLENSFTTATTNDAGTNVVQAEASTDAADLGDILGAGEHVRSIEISYSTILNQKKSDNFRTNTLITLPVGILFVHDFLFSLLPFPTLFVLRTY